jgi:hypothetical protein
MSPEGHGLTWPSVTGGRADTAIRLVGPRRRWEPLKTRPSWDDTIGGRVRRGFPLDEGAPGFPEVR